MRQTRFVLAALGLAMAASTAHAQQEANVGACATPDSVAFRGNKRITDDVLRADVGITPKSTINQRTLTRAIRDLYATNQFESDIRTSCDVANGKSVLIF